MTPYRTPATPPEDPGPTLGDRVWVWLANLDPETCAKVWTWIVFIALAIALYRDAQKRDNVGTQPAPRECREGDSRG